MVSPLLSHVTSPLHGGPNRWFLQLPSIVLLLWLNDQPILNWYGKQIVSPSQHQVRNIPHTKENHNNKIDRHLGAFFNTLDRLKLARKSARKWRWRRWRIILSDTKLGHQKVCDSYAHPTHKKLATTLTAAYYLCITHLSHYFESLFDFHRRWRCRLHENAH